MSDGSVTHPDLGLTGGWAIGDDYGTKMNANLRRLDGLIMASVLDKDLATPPGSPTDGQRYIVAGSPTGAWSGHAKDIAIYESTAWVFYTPKEGWIAWVADEDKVYVYDGAAWAELSAAGGSAHNLLSATHSDTTAHVAVRGDIVVADSTPKFARLPIGGAGKVLYSDGTDASWQDPPVGAAHNLLSSTHADALTGSVVRGDLIVGNTTPKWARLALGASGKILKSDGNDAYWGDPPTSGGPPGGTGYLLLTPALFNGSTTMAARDFTDSTLPKVSFAGNTDIYESCEFVVPGDLTTLSAIHLYFAMDGASAANIRLRCGMRKLTNGTDSTTAVTYATAQTVTPPNVTDQTVVVSMTLPSVSLSPGDVVVFLINRNAFTDAADVSADTMLLYGARLTYV